MSRTTTIRLTMAQALVRHLLSYRSDLRGKEIPFFHGLFAIFGHGNVTCLGEALQQQQESLPTWRGQNEQSMALAAVAFAKAQRRRQVMVASSSIGPGATNMVTAAALAHANRLPVLILAGDVFAKRLQDPVLQQIENFHDPTVTANDCFKPVVRYWDRITHPSQIVSSLPQAVATLLDAGDCGPAFLALCQDTQETAYDYPKSFFDVKFCPLLRIRPDREIVKKAAALLKKAQKPLIVCGGGVRYSFAEETLGNWAEECAVPVVETVAGKASLLADHPFNIGAIGVIGTTAANDLARRADLVVAIGTRLQDFTTGSATLLQGKSLLSVNASRFDAVKRNALAIVADAKEGILALQAALQEQGGYKAPLLWQEEARQAKLLWLQKVKQHIKGDNSPWGYGEVVGCINALAGKDDVIVTAAGGLPGEINALWQAVASNSVDCEFGYSCMGYEIAGAWGAAMAKRSNKEFKGDIISFCGDGSYLMLNSELYSTVLTGHKIIVILCDNGGFAVIDRLQRAKGGVSFNNMLEHTRRADNSTKPPRKLPRVDFVAHARSLGCEARRVENRSALEEAFHWARGCDRSVVLLCETHPDKWAPPSEAWWDVGVPEVSPQEAVRTARSEHEKGRKLQ